MRWLGWVLVAGLLAACPSKEEIVKKAEETGKFATEQKAAIVKGVGEGLKGEGKEGAAALTEGVGEVVKGAAKGLDKSLAEVKLEVAPELAAKGVRVERGSRLASAASQPARKGVTIYVVYDQPFGGKLLVRALDDGGKELGRALAEVKQPAGAAGYVDFAFDERTPIEAVNRYAVSAL
jgi:hypothetical protein